MFSEPRYEQESAESAKSLLWTISAQGVVRSISSRITRITGWNEVDCYGKPFQSFVHPIDITRLVACYPSLLKGETVVLENFRCLTRNGLYQTFSLSFVPSFQDKGMTEIIVLGRLEQLEAGLTNDDANNVLMFSGSKESPRPFAILEHAGIAKLLESLLANAPVGFSLLDNELRVICLNQTFSKMTGFSPEQQLGLSFKDLLPASATVLEPMLRNVLSTGSSVLEHEVVLQKAAFVGLSRYALLSFYPIPDDQDNVCGVAVMAMDITDRKRADHRAKILSEELTRSNEALENFCHTVSHDLSEPLRTISTYVTLIDRKYSKTFSPEASDCIQLAMQGTRYMKSLIDGLLDYAKVGNSEFKVSKVSATEVIQTVISNLKTVIEESGSVITFDPLPIVMGDNLLLTQVFQNLIANAIKFRCVAPCKIHVAVERRLKDWVFSISDNGIGIKSDYLSSIFAPFKKLHAQSEYAGAGLGLSICQKGIERMGGEIWVTSKLGTGSKFSFTLPMDAFPKKVDDACL